MVFMPSESLEPKPPSPPYIDRISRSTQIGTSNSRVLRGHRISCLVIYNSKFKHQSIRETLWRKKQKKNKQKEPLPTTSNPLFSHQINPSPFHPSEHISYVYEKELTKPATSSHVLKAFFFQGKSTISGSHLLR